MAGTKPGHDVERCRSNESRQMRSVHSRPAEPPHDGAAHHPVFVVLGQERQLLGEMGNALLIGEAGEAVDAGGEVGAPEAAARSEGVDYALEMIGETAKR